MKKLDQMEKAIIKILAMYNPFSFMEIEHIYLRVKSFDIAIRVMELACKHNCSPDQIITDFKKESS